MNIITVFQRFPDHEACIEHLEKVRWGNSPACPSCGSERVGRKADGFRVGRWNCHKCHASFNVLAGTIFQKTKIDLQKWFLAISIILNAKKSVSSHQLSRDIDVSQPTAWYMGLRIRRAMTTHGDLLSGIVEADEAYIGGKPRKPNQRGGGDSEAAKRGRGTDKMAVIGAVERGGRVVAQPMDALDSASITAFLTGRVDRASLLMTDEYPGYRGIAKRMRHATIEHATRYVDGMVHTNTIEGFWALLKRAWYGSHHHYTRKHAGAYVAEACYKYSTRRLPDTFGAFIRQAVAV
ncbi:MAG: IS1595 family transposase [Chloroflexota bacterium]|nr:IS1595 family transposase [Chloroflexota bacterium]